ncbi:hypothetical protein ACPPVW_13845 [Leifsonia sp. McL0607]|uniref:hypothetical protein n=1 Tax=Leifsonia sp. McL0607 TaxID=3415672 RepID=UPI003CF6B136
MAHLIVLAVGLVAYSVFSTRSWFFYDDWYYLVRNANVIWAHHVGHWSTVPALVFLAIQRTFGMDHYLPFALPAILAQLAAVHFVWRLTVRAGVRAWIATAFTVLLVFLGAGAEALAWAVQIGFVGAIAGTLGAVVLLDSERLSWLRGLSAAILVLLSLASSGVAIPFVGSAIALAWVRHGLLRTLAVFAVPLGAYAAWFLIERGTGGSLVAGGAETLESAPRFAISMLDDGFGRMFPIAVLGGLVFVALMVWWIFTVHDARRRGLAAYLLFPAAAAFALLTGFTRAEYGLETASSSRYVFVVVIAIAPFMALCFDLATRRAPLIPAVTLVLIVAAWNAGGTVEALAIRAHRVDSTRSELARAAATLRATPGCLADSDRPSPQWAPDVTVADVRWWLAQGWYHPAPSAPEPSCPSR